MISKVDIGTTAFNNRQIFNKKNNEIQKQTKSKENEKLESIKKSIQSGSYKVDIEKTAGKIADTLL